MMYVELQQHKYQLIKIKEIKRKNKHYNYSNSLRDLLLNDIVSNMKGNYQSDYNADWRADKLNF